MKNFILMLFCLVSLQMVGQTRYQVHVSLNDAQKETIGLLDQHITSYDRRINENVITFSTQINYSEWFIDSLFVKIGVEPFLVIKDKTEAYSIEKIGGNNCETAQILCSNSGITGTTSGYGTQELNSTNQGCLSTEHQSSWYYVNIQTGGTLNMRINPNNNFNDYDFAVWGPFTSVTAPLNCPPISAPIRCSWAAGGGNTGMNTTATDNSEGAGGDRWVNNLNVNAGEIYIILIDNFSVGSGYDLDFSWGGNNSTAVLGCTPITLPIELYSFEGNSYNITNNLTWVTLSEINNDYFVIQRSSDGYDWENIGKVYGAGTSLEKNSYSFNDDNYKNVINYYRLKQIDFNGGYKYSDIITIDNRPINTKIIRITNLLGQEINEYYRGVIIIQYDDGTTIKKIQ